MREYSEVNSVLLIQKHVRRFLIQKKYAINHLPTIDLTFYPTFMVGNDPIMHALSKYTEKDNKIALIGTSGLRSLAMALRLSPKDIYPKIFIMDNSEEVYAFWYGIRKIAQEIIEEAEEVTEKRLCQTPQQKMKTNVKDANRTGRFLRDVKRFLCQNPDLYRFIDTNAYQSGCNTDIAYPQQNPLIFLSDLILKYSCESVVKTIQHASLIKQDWADEMVFLKIKNVLNYHQIKKVYMYPSNIVACSDDLSQQQILRNIEKFSPYLTIHTDLCRKHDLPENVYYFTDNTPAQVFNALFEKTSCQPSTLSPHAFFNKYFSNESQEKVPPLCGNQI